MPKIPSFLLAVCISLLLFNTHCGNKEGCQDGAVQLDSLRNALLYTVNAYVSIRGIDLEKVDEVGLCWNETGNPDISDNLNAWGKPLVKTLEIVVTGLQPNRRYYLRAYIRADDEVCYSGELSTQTWDGKIQDIEGRQYAGVQIGTQGWMAENLRVSHYPDGSAIDLGQGANRLYWYGSGRPYVPGFDYDLDNDGDADTQDSLLYVNQYGPLYSWYSANNYYDPAPNPALEGQRVRPNVRDVCPQGWHIPSRLEWQDLRLFLEQQHNVDTTAAFLLARTAWLGGGGNDLYGFGMLPGAYWQDPGNSHSNILGKAAFMWLSSEGNSANGEYIQMDDLDKRIYGSSIGKGIHGLCIRCLKDR